MTRKRKTLKEEPSKKKSKAMKRAFDGCFGNFVDWFRDPETRQPESLTMICMGYVIAYSKQRGNSSKEWLYRLNVLRMLPPNLKMPFYDLMCEYLRPCHGSSECSCPFHPDGGFGLNTGIIVTYGENDKIYFDLDKWHSERIKDKNSTKTFLYDRYWQSVGFKAIKGDK